MIPYEPKRHAIMVLALSELRAHARTLLGHGLMKAAEMPLLSWSENAITVEEALNKMLDHIKEAPTVDAELKWIPISERTPGAEHVLVTLKWGEDDFEVTELDYGVDVACGGRFAKYVTAWMPLPKAYGL